MLGRFVRRLLVAGARRSPSSRHVDDIAPGDFDITGDLVIDGTGEAATIILRGAKGSPAGRVTDVAAGAIAELRETARLLIRPRARSRTAACSSKGVPVRKLIIWSVAVTSVVAPAAIAFAANRPLFGVQTEDDAAKAGTPARPRGVALLFASEDTKTQSARLTRVTFLFDRNLVFRGSAFPQCATAAAVAGTAGCGFDMEVGRTPATYGGRSWAKVYNGPQGNKVVFEADAGGGQYYTVVATLSKAGGIYGKKLVIPIPGFLVRGRGKVSGFIFWLSDTSTQRTPYLGLKGCTGGVLRFRVSFAYKNAPTRSRTATTDCRR
jgi:hypothetical protein